MQLLTKLGSDPQRRVQRDSGSIIAGGSAGTPGWAWRTGEMMNEQPTKEWWLQNDPVKEGWGPFESEAAAWRHLFGRDPGAEDIRQHEEAGWYVGFINRWPNVMCTPSGASTELYTMTTPVPHGTIALMAFAATLPQRAENLRGFFDYNAAAADLMRCKEIIDRLAQHESDIEAEPGEN